MPLSDQPAECSLRIRAMNADLRDLLDGRADLRASDEPDGRDWSADIVALNRAIARAVWARDALIVLARADGIPWPELQDHTGDRDSTLHGRYRRFLARESVRAAERET